MEVISETFKMKKKDALPEILMRIYSVCKADPTFPLKEQLESIEREVGALNKKISKQSQLIQQTTGLRDDLSKRLQMKRQENFELKTRLLEELGSDI